jgi:5-methylcytosine-specific restriction endonuclease McrA
MKNHTKIYFEYFGYDKSDFIACEVCGATAVDINHIDARGMGGSKEKDSIDNLMAMCRKCHTEFGDIKEKKQWLKDLHQLNLSR